jgi:hypothetical protein
MRDPSQSTLIVPFAHEPLAWDDDDEAVEYEVVARRQD